MRTTDDRNVLDSICTLFCKVLEKHTQYIVVSGFVAISSGRTRGTEDIDVILERVPLETFEKIHSDLEKEGFECIQGPRVQDLYRHYLQENTSIRYILKGHMLPEMELKLAKDELDTYQIKHRVKLPLTGLDVWFSSINTNIAFKEELLKTDKDIEDARHLRKVYAEEVDENEINRVKKYQAAQVMIDPQRLEQIDRWAQFVRTSNGAWKKPHTEFINAQFEKANAFYRRLVKQPGGKEKIIRIFGIKNLDAAPFLK